jgi:hypothetical protein
MQIQAMLGLTLPQGKFIFITMVIGLNLLLVIQDFLDLKDQRDRKEQIAMLLDQ